MPEFAGQYGGGGYVQSYGSVPASTQGTTITCNASVNVKGTYVELIASTTHDANWIIVHLGNASASIYLVDIAIGAATEQVIIPDLLYFGKALGGFSPYMFPIRIPAGSRLTARCQGTGGGSTMDVVIQLVSGTMLGGGSGPAWVDAYGAVAASTGTNVDPGGVAHTESGWVEIAAATARPHTWIVLSARFGDGAIAASRWLIDIGIGAATETVLVSDIHVVAETTADIPMGGAVQHFPIFVPQASRLTARAQCLSIADGDRDLYVKLYGC